MNCSSPHYPAYWLKVDLPHKLEHARFVRATEEAGKKLATRVGFDAARGVTELTIFAPDHPWLLSVIAGAVVLVWPWDSISIVPTTLRGGGSSVPIFSIFRTALITVE